MKFKSTVLAVFVLCAFSRLAFADGAADLFADVDTSAPAATTGDETASSSESPSQELTISVDIKPLLTVPADPDNWNFASSGRSPSLASNLGLEYRTGEMIAVSNWSIGLKTTGLFNGTAAADALTLAPQENYVRWAPNGLTLTAGYQTIAWGSAYGSNPTDYLNPADYTQGLNFSKLPILALSGSMYPADWLSLDLVYEPLERGSLFSVDFAGEIPAVLFNGYAFNMGTGTLVPVTNTKTVTTVEPVQDLSSFVAGAKINLLSRVIDVSLSYVYDFDRFYTPAITVKTDPIYIASTTTPTGNSYVRVDSVELQRLRMHRIGLDVKASLGDFVVWLEGSWNQNEGFDPTSYAVRSPSLDTVLGSDVSFGPDGEFYVNLQGTFTWRPWYQTGTEYTNGLPDSTKVGDSSYMAAFYQKQLVQALGNQNEGMDVGGILNFKFEAPRAIVVPQVSAVYTLPLLYNDSVYTRLGALILKPEVAFKPADGFTITVGADLVYSWLKAGDGTVSLNRSDAYGRGTQDNKFYLLFSYGFSSSIAK